MPKGWRDGKPLPGPFGNKGPLTPENFERLLAQLRKTEAKREASKHRQRGLDKFNHQRYTHKGHTMFSHLPPDIRARAQQKFALYKEKHKQRLESLTGKRKVQLIGSLAAAASRWAKAPAPSTWGYAAAAKQRHFGRLQTRLGMREPAPKRLLGESWQMKLDRIQREHDRHGAAPEAEVGSANMEGV